jgi:phospholipase/carboxylesterase
MRGEQHKGKGLAYLTILPDDYDPQVSYPLVIMLHGFGANMMDLAGLAPTIDRRGYVYACPNAPISFDLGRGVVGYGWTPPRGQATPEEVRNAETLLAGFFDEVFQKLNTSPGRAVLMGFSQGGGMTYRCGLARPETFAGLVALSASLPDPKELEGRLPQRRNQPIFMAHGQSDPLVPLESAWATRQFLERAGYQPEYREYAMGHEISQEVLDDLVPWVAKVLPPLHSQG